MTIAEIYKKYQIMPSLQLHMLRVAGVSQIICDSFEKIPDQVRDDELDSIKIDTQNIIKACLLHDMGNILKFNLELFPEFLQPEGTEYWQQVKDTYQQKYGTDEHKATLSICQELNMDKRVLELVDCFQFLLAEKNAQSDDFGKKICAYADMRVEPHRIVSLEQRLEEGKKRFYQNKPELFNKKLFQTMSQSLVTIEEQLFIKTSVKPTDITDKTVQPLIEQLQTIEI